mmetsp:Transcript_36033/g.96811  ORF Transcript_36033/g.96811 Transcript_36033/m.96811 type:complete len:287 (+) Transcript_36033:420-1280(+)
MPQCTLRHPSASGSQIGLRSKVRVDELRAPLGLAAAVGLQVVFQLASSAVGVVLCQHAGDPLGAQFLHGQDIVCALGVKSTYLLGLVCDDDDVALGPDFAGRPQQPLVRDAGDPVVGDGYQDQVDSLLHSCPDCVRRGDVASRERDVLRVQRCFQRGFVVENMKLAQDLRCFMLKLSDECSCNLEETKENYVALLQIFAVFGLSFVTTEDTPQAAALWQDPTFVHDGVVQAVVVADNVRSSARKNSEHPNRDRHCLVVDMSKFHSQCADHEAKLTTLGEVQRGQNG